MFPYFWEFPKRTDSIYQLFSVMKQHPGSGNSQKHCPVSPNAATTQSVLKIIGNMKIFLSGFQGKVQKSMRSSERTRSLILSRPQASHMEVRTGSEIWPVFLEPALAQAWGWCGSGHMSWKGPWELHLEDRTTIRWSRESCKGRGMPRGRGVNDQLVDSLENKSNTLRHK